QIAAPERAAELSLSSNPPPHLGNAFRLGYGLLPLRACNPMQDFVCCFLNSGIGLMKLARCLGSKLAKHITVLHRMYSVKYQIRAHCLFPFLVMKLAAVSAPRRQEHRGLGPCTPGLFPTMSS